MTTLRIPDCAAKQYWFVTEEWNELVQNSPIATPDNPNPQQMRGIVRRKQNLVIAMHPVAHAVLQQASGKSDYVLTDPLLIKRELYDWVIQLNQQVRQVQEGSSNGDGLESELRNAVESDSKPTEDSGTDSGVQVPPSSPMEG